MIAKVHHKQLTLQNVQRYPSLANNQYQAESPGPDVGNLLHGHPYSIGRHGYRSALADSYMLEELGVDNVIVIPFDRAFSALSGEEFADDYLIGKVGAETLVAGYNHRFGHDRIDCDTLAASGRLRVVKVGPCRVDGEHVSSTVIRRLLDEGKTAEAELLLGYSLQTEK